jgi:hypothetical protein
MCVTISTLIFEYTNILKMSNKQLVVSVALVFIAVSLFSDWSKNHNKQHRVQCENNGGVLRQEQSGLYCVGGR